MTWLTKSLRGLVKRGRQAVFLTLLATSCSNGGASDVPPLRSLGWFSYLDGADIRRACLPGSADRYRLVYNGVWGEQVRDYEIHGDPAAGTTQLDIRVLFPEAPGSIDLRDPLASFRGHRASIKLTPSELRAFTEGLRASGFYDATAAGLVLPSDGYYWVVAACERGAFHFNAYLYPSPRFGALQFPNFLFAHDATGVAVRPPGPSAPRGSYAHRATDPPFYSIFDLEVGKNGLVNLPHLF
jgi:hypothetical protein